MSQVHQFSSREYDYPETAFYDYNNSENTIFTKADRLEKDTLAQDRRVKTVKAFKIIIAVLLFVIFVQVLYHLYFARNINIEKIVIESGAGLSIQDDKLLEMAGIGKGVSFFALDTAQVELRLERFPQIASAAVEKKFPDTLNIHIEGRRPLAVCLVESGDRLIPAAVDSKGVIFQLGKSVNELNLPVMSGVRIDDARLGSVMPSPVTGFLKSLESLRKESPAFFNSISEFRIIRKTSDDFEVLMYPQNYNIPVRIGSRIDSETLSYIMLVLDVVKQQGISGYLEELDFRTDEVVYRIREE